MIIITKMDMTIIRTMIIATGGKTEEPTARGTTGGMDGRVPRG